MKLRFYMELSELMPGDERVWQIQKRDTLPFGGDLEGVAVMHARTCANSLIRLVQTEGPPGNPISVAEDHAVLLGALREIWGDMEGADGPRQRLSNLLAGYVPPLEARRVIEILERKEGGA